MLSGVDISQWQANPDYDLVADGINFAMVRASYATSIVDKVGWVHRTMLRQKGVLLGHYHYAEPGRSHPAVEARVFLDSVGWRFDGEPLALDIEVDAPDLVEWCRQFMQICINVDGNPPLIYLNDDFLARYDWRPIADMGCKLWRASWNLKDGFDFAHPVWKRPIMWQYSDLTTIPGFPYPVDGDLFEGDTAEFKALAPRS